MTRYYCFQGILPEILEELLTARKRAKADLKVFIYFLVCVGYNLSIFCWHINVIDINWLIQLTVAARGVTSVFNWLQPQWSTSNGQIKLI